ncbi:MAG: DUF790 family protein [Acidobacteriota bacterium]
MLTADLVRGRLYKGEVRPGWVDPSDTETVDLATQMIATFAEHVGASRGELKQALKEITGSGTAFLLHRGLAKLLEDRCEIDMTAVIEPEVVRETVFDLAARVWQSDEPFDRTAVLANAKETLLASREADAEPVDFDIATTLYADLKDEQIVQHFEEPTPTWLLERYNTALAQGVLLRANEMTIHLGPGEPRRHRALFQRIKFFQLLYRIDKDDDGWLIRLDGPLSLFRGSQRYGVKMAQFLPALLHVSGWRLEAQVRWGPRRKRATFQLDPSRGLVPHTRLTGAWQPDELTQFAERFAELDSDWEVERDGELIDLGGQSVLIPDFVFQHRTSGIRVPMEVLGYWNRGVVRRRLKELRDHGPDKMILAIAKNLASGEKEENVPASVYIFRTMPLPRQVLKRLAAFS